MKFFVLVSVVSQDGPLHFFPEDAGHVVGEALAGEPVPDDIKLNIIGVLERHHNAAAPNPQEVERMRRMIERDVKRDLFRDTPDPVQLTADGQERLAIVCQMTEQTIVDMIHDTIVTRGLDAGIGMAAISRALAHLSVATGCPEDSIIEGLREGFVHARQRRARADDSEYTSRLRAQAPEGKN